MKTATPALVALLNAAGGANPLYDTDFFTLTLQDGTRLYFGAGDFTVAAADATIWNPLAIDTGLGMWFAGIKWPPGLMSSGDGQTAHWKTGLDTDTWALKFTPRPFDPVTGDPFPDKINGVPWLEAARAGALDNADVIVSTAYYAAQPSQPPINGVSPTGTLVVFRGQIGAVDCSDSAVYMSVTDYRFLTTQMMPRNLYQGSCRHTLYDARCALDRNNFYKIGTVGAGSTRQLVVATADIPPPPGSGAFRLGLFMMTSGLNSGFQRVVTAWDGGPSFSFLNPFPFDVEPGDTFHVFAGCDKRLATCGQFFNQLNFGGEPYVPIPEVSLA